jgi:hypothetical protein
MKRLIAIVVFCLLTLASQAQDNVIMLGYVIGQMPVIVGGNGFDITYHRKIVTRAGARVTMGTYGGESPFVLPGFNFDITHRERFSYADFNGCISLYKNTDEANFYGGTGFTLFQSNYYSPINTVSVVNQGVIETSYESYVHRSGMMSGFLAFNYQSTKGIFFELSGTVRTVHPFQDVIAFRSRYSVIEQNVSVAGENFWGIENCISFALRIGYNF